MTGWPQAPVIYEIDTWPWLFELRERFGKRLTLADVPDDVWDAVTPPGTDAVWLMGVWERSPAGLAVARQNENLQRAFRAALPDLSPADVAGSPYCVRRYVVDDELGGPAALAVARTELARRGLKLVLDYVPNHVAPDHPAVTACPEWFVPGTADDLLRAPADWFEVGGRVLAHGRDPYFPSWPDVIQLNAFRPEVREATARVLGSIAEQCDGVRCDMAMLVTNAVFAETWGMRAGPAPAEEFWELVIGRLRVEAADVVLIAEAYWDTEWTLQQQGFDFCYDKRLYDRLAHEDPNAVRRHLGADLDYQRRLMRFIENHDEPRAAATLRGGRDRAAAVAVATLPGAVLWHDGQLTGRRVQLPVFLSRRPAEAVDEDLRQFYNRLLVATVGRRRAEWALLGCEGWADNATADDLLAWAWHQEVPHTLVVVNLSGHASQARVRLPFPLAGRDWLLTDLLNGGTFERPGDELAGEGLYVDLPAWGSHVFDVSRR